MGYTIITGASSGIGRACAIKLAKKGHNLILASRRIERLEVLKLELSTKFNVDIIAYKLDVRDLEAIDKFAIDISDYEIDVFVNNAGLAAGKTSFEKYEWSDFQQMIDTNILGFTKIAQMIIPKLIRSQGHIINISSIAGIEAYEGGSVYSATKAYVKMLSKSMRIDLMGTGVRVTDIAPGAVETEFSFVRFKGNQDMAEAIYSNFSPLIADDIADAVDYVISTPKSVNIEYMVIMPTAQASATRIYREQK